MNIITNSKNQDIAEQILLQFSFRSQRHSISNVTPSFLDWTLIDTKIQNTKCYLLSESNIGINILFLPTQLQSLNLLLFQDLLFLNLSEYQIDSFLASLSGTGRIILKDSTLPKNKYLNQILSVPEIEDGFYKIKTQHSSGDEFDFCLTASAFLTVSNLKMDDVYPYLAELFPNRPKKPTKKFKYITQSPNFGDYYQWDTITYKKLPPKERQAQVNRLTALNNTMLKQFYTTRHEQFSQIAQNFGSFRGLKKPIKNFLNSYLLSNDSLKTVVSNLDDPAHFIYSFFVDSIQNKKPTNDLYDTFFLTMTISNILIELYEFLATCGVITQSDAKTVAANLSASLEKLNSDFIRNEELMDADNPFGFFTDDEHYNTSEHEYIMDELFKLAFQHDYGVDLNKLTPSEQQQFLDLFTKAISDDKQHPPYMRLHNKKK